MAKSRYDADHDGVCDADACRDVQVLVLPGAQGPQVAAEIAREVASVGIHVRVEVKRGDELFAELSDPTTQVPLASSIGIGGAYLNTANAISALFSSSQIGASANFSLVGASPAQLRHWGYHVSSVPSIDDRIDACLLIQGSAQIRCWASLDQYVMEQVTPWVPLIFENRLMMTSPRVVAFSYDQLVNEPSLDRIALRPGS
jgi:hypothetical protein